MLSGKNTPIQLEHGGSCCNDTYCTSQETLHAHRVPVIWSQSMVVHAAMIRDITVQETLYAHRVPVIRGQSKVVYAAMIMICIEQRMLTPFPSSGVRAWWFMLQCYILYIIRDTACSPRSCHPQPEHGGSCCNDTYCTSDETLHAHHILVLRGQSIVVHATMIHTVLYITGDTACSPSHRHPGSDMGVHDAYYSRVECGNFFGSVRIGPVTKG